MLRCCLGAYGCPNHAWMPSLGAGLIRLSQGLTALHQRGLAVRRRGWQAAGEAPTESLTPSRKTSGYSCTLRAGPLARLSP